MDKCLFISRSALEYNINYYLKNTKKNFIAVVKNNAYGHGIEKIIPILEKQDVSMYGVSNLIEAKELNKYTNRDIIIFDKLNSYDDLSDCMVVTVISKKHLKQLIELNKELRIHLKINVNMKRKGIEPFELEECLELIKNSKLKLEGVYTHYSSHKIKVLKRELSIFKSVIDKLENKDILIHASSSVSSLCLKENVTNAIRVGVGMYGLKKLIKEMEPLKIVSELKCESKNSYPIKCFDRFSYHDLYFGKKGYVVVVNIGYGDGLFSKEKLKGYIENTNIKEIGNRNMDNMYFYSKDYIMENSEIEIFGKNNLIDDFAKRNKIPVCKIIASLNHNIDKEIVD